MTRARSGDFVKSGTCDAQTLPRAHPTAPVLAASFKKEEIMFGKFLSRNPILATTALLLSLSLSACGGETPAAATVPTIVPTYTPAAAIPVGDTAPAAVAPTATPMPTATTRPTVAPTATATVEATATATPAATTETVAPTAAAEPTATSAPMETSTVAPTAMPVATVVTPPTVVTPVAETGAAGAAITDTMIAAGDTLTATLPVSDAVSADLLPVDMVAALASADPVHGQALTVANGCIACHALGEGQQLVGPSWYGIGARAATRVAGESAEEYLYRSIVAPNDHVVEGFVAGIMPPVYGDTIPAPDLADIISYLLSLQ